MLYTQATRRQTPTAAQAHWQMPFVRHPLLLLCCAVCAVLCCAKRVNSPSASSAGGWRSRSRRSSLQQQHNPSAAAQQETAVCETAVCGLSTLLVHALLGGQAVYMVHAAQILLCRCMPEAEPQPPDVLPQLPECVATAPGAALLQSLAAVAAAVALVPL
jgi:hypothetical protein